VGARQLGALVRERVELGQTIKKRKREVEGNENRLLLPEAKIKEKEEYFVSC
jgi:hypothetical protein